MKRVIFLLALIFPSVCVYSQNVQTRAINAFDKISAFGSLDIVLEKGNKESLKLESETVDLEYVHVKSDGMTLKINMTDMLFSDRRQVKVKITYRELRNITLRGGAEINDSSIISGDKLEITAGSGASVTLKLQLNAIQATVGQGAVITLEGKCKTQEIEASTGGIYNAYDLKCDSSYVKSNTGGVAKVYSVDLLDAAASTGGQISYRSEPQLKKEKTILGGTIEKVVE